MQMSWEYLAGLFDGEGCIVVAGPGIEWRIAQNDRGRQALVDVQSFLQARGYSVAFLPNYYQYKGQQKVMYVVRVAKKADVQQICHHLLPYLRVRQLAALDAWRWLTLYPAMSNKQASLCRRRRSRAQS